jgi:hypothetical protein
MCCPAAYASAAFRIDIEAGITLPEALLGVAAGLPGAKRQGNAVAFDDGRKLEVDPDTGARALRTAGSDMPILISLTARADMVETFFRHLTGSPDG